MTLLHRLRNDAWELLVMSVGWIIVFLANVPINFLTIFVVTITGYLMGELIRLFVYMAKQKVTK
jgi:hypothetical protein